jgi:hypothetical protein
MLLTIVLSACSTLVILDPSDRIDKPVKGSVPPLEHFLPPDSTTPVKLILLHGVGDHCSGFALGDKGWLDKSAQNKTGLRPLDVPSTPKKFYSTNFLNVQLRDNESYLTVVKQHFEYKLSSSRNAVRIEAIEITWSPLTQWVKTKQLRYDANNDIKDPLIPCLAAPDNPYTSAPSRQWLNGYIKETVFDRNLADAVLYMGTYGLALQRGVADALCHGLTDQPEDKKCVWPHPSDSDHTRYIIVTHSLGSRIIYDVLLGLQGKEECRPQEVFSVEERSQSQRFAEHMMRNTPVIYMMANQLPLLGLANADPYATSREPPYGYAIEGNGTPNSPILDLAIKDATKAATDFDSKINSCKNPMRALANQKKKLMGSAMNAPVLNIVAFSDTNDLLSWAIPEWYVRTESENESDLEIKVTNVFVQNGVHWFHLFEDPGSAHSGYFRNQDVWDVIRCGAEKGILQCNLH